MFTPENFYLVLRENYARPNNSLMYVPNRNGEKDVHYFSWYENKDDYLSYFYSERGIKTHLDQIWMYDQEPLEEIALAQWRQFRIENSAAELQSILEDLPYYDLMACSIRCTKIPIWCTSEYNSVDSREMQKRLFVLCYYWYHAFVARDWYRHYQYNQSLEVKDRSRSRHRFLLYARATDGTRTYRRQLLDHLQPFRDQVLHDWDQKRQVSSDASAMINLQDAGTSAIHLVAETLFDADKIYLTEKVFKPMVMSQPFILWAPAGSLDYLRRYGFRTFHHVWSEQYDLEKDPTKRMQMLLDLVEWMRGLDQTQFYELYQKCLPVIEHNRRWFYSDKFMDHCWSELDQNFKNAFFQSRELLKDHPGGQIAYELAQRPDLLPVPYWTQALKSYIKSLDATSVDKIIQRYPVLSSL